MLDPTRAVHSAGGRLEGRASGKHQDMEHHGRRQSGPRSEDEGTLRGALRPRGPVQFGIIQVQEAGVVRLEISGELDILTTPRLATELGAVVRRSDDNVIVDLRRTDFIDSAGLQILLGTQRRLGRVSRRLSVVCDDGPVRRVIEMTRLGAALGLTRDGESSPMDDEETG
jgi:anti-anti-sigma factor